VASCEKQRLIVSSYPSETLLAQKPKIVPGEGGVRDIKWGQEK